MNERAISSSTQKIQQGIEELLKQGLVKVKSMGGELCYQIVSVKKKYPNRHMTLWLVGF